MKLNKEQFKSFMKEHFHKTILTETFINIEYIKLYCKKNGLSEDDDEIKNVLKELNKIKRFYFLFSLQKEKPTEKKIDAILSDRSD
jgi:hypothetical protein